MRNPIPRIRVWCLLLAFLLLGGCASTANPADPSEAPQPEQAVKSTEPAAGPPPQATAAATDRKGPITRIVDAGKLRIGTSGEQPPLSMTTKSGELIGLDIAIGSVLARTMGVEAEFVAMPFGDLLDRLAAGDVDVVISGMAITAERVVRAEFAGPYYTSGKSVLTRRPDLRAADAVAALDLPALTLAVLAGSTSESFARTNFTDATVLATSRLDEAIALVIEGGADALIADTETCHYAVLRHPDAGLLEPLYTFTVEPMGVAVSRDEARLARLIDTYLEALDHRGVLEKTRQFWLENPSWVKALR